MSAYARNQPDKILVTSSYGDIITYEDEKYANFSREEVNEYKEAFLKYDLTGDGFLDFHEVTKMLELLGETKTATEVRELIAEVDEDGDKKLSFAEFLQVR